jgi:hypothetical protein
MPERKIVPSTSIIVASFVMSDGAAEIARAILASVVSALETVAPLSSTIDKIAVVKNL